MTKFATHAEYPPSAPQLAEAALLTAWGSLSRYHEDLVLVGGLAVRVLSKPPNAGTVAAVTADVDLGIALATSGGSYGTITSDLRAVGFKFVDSRFARDCDGIPLFIDFLTEHPAATKGAAMVDDVLTSVFPGIDRALLCHRRVRVTGVDLFGTAQRAEIPVADIGPLLVLKLNAYANRRQPKDAYDIWYAMYHYPDGPVAAVRQFQAEGSAGNRGYEAAQRALLTYFVNEEQEGPTRAAAFIHGAPPHPTAKLVLFRQLQQDVVTAARALVDVR